MLQGTWSKISIDEGGSINQNFAETSSNLPKVEGVEGKYDTNC